ncbi:MAG: cytochrome c1, partial [Henriciella sp.]
MTFFRILNAVFAASALSLSAHAAGGAKHAHAPEDGWSFASPVGKLEMDSVQRGFQVYREVCASCHGMKLLSYRNLGEPGGPFYDAMYPNANDNPLVKQFAAEDEILDPVPNDVGDYDYRPARPSDRFRYPYANDQAARAANNGALPPDLSV